MEQIKFYAAMVFIFTVVWVIICLLINSLLMCTTKKRFKLGKRKKFQGKKSPIYELLKTTYSGYTIQKWELGYGELDEWKYAFIPFSYLFESYKYVCYNTMGSFDCDQINKIQSLEVEFESRYKIRRLELEASNSAKLSEEKTVDKLNQEYKENVI